VTTSLLDQFFPVVRRTVVVYVVFFSPAYIIFFFTSEENLHEKVQPKRTNLTLAGNDQSYKLEIGLF